MKQIKCLERNLKMINADIKKIADKYGLAHQLKKFKEECAEAIQAAIKYELAVNGEYDEKETYKHLEEEIADVIIMCEQMKYLLEEHEITAYINRKVERQLERM